MMKPYYQDNAVTIYHADCRVVLPELEKIDLVVADPPYGIGENAYRIASRGKLAKAIDYGSFDWDKKPWPQELIDRVISQGKQAVIWGGNYYSMPAARCWLIWDKLNGNNDFADCEMAWTNFKKSVRKKEHLWNGMIRKNHEPRQHPTQKPLEIISWCITMADEPQTILDPCMGSGTTLRAAKDLGRKAIGIELDEKYCEIAAKRMSQEVLSF